MRFDVTPAQLKKLASRVGDHLPHASHTQLLDVLARGLGWRDWHEVSTLLAEHRQGKAFPIALNKALQTVGHLADVGYMEYRQQMQEAFARAFGTTCPMMIDDTALFALIDALGFTDNTVQTLKTVCKGLPSAQIQSGFYRLSLTDALGLNPRPEDQGKYMSTGEMYGVRSCEGYEIDPEESPIAVDPTDLLGKAQYNRWLDTVTGHSFDEPEQKAGYSREPIFLVCEERGKRQWQSGMLMGAWEVECPAEKPHYTGTLHLLASAAYDEEALWLLGQSLPDVVGGAIDAAVLGVAACPQAQLTVRMVMDNPNKHTKEIANTCFELLSDRESFAPCLRASRARLELVETKGSVRRVVDAKPGREVSFAEHGPALQLRQQRHAQIVWTSFATAEALTGAAVREGPASQE